MTNGQPDDFRPAPLKKTIQMEVIKRAAEIIKDAITAFVIIRTLRQIT